MLQEVFERGDFLWSLLNTHYRYNMSNLGQSEIVLIQGPICPKCNANEFYETPRSRPFWYTILRKGMQVLSISFVFCSQKYLVQMGGRSLANTNSKALNLNPTISGGKGSGLVLLIRQGWKNTNSKALWPDRLLKHGTLSTDFITWTPKKETWSCHESHQLIQKLYLVFNSPFGHTKVCQVPGAGITLYYSAELLNN